MFWILLFSSEEIIEFQRIKLIIYENNCVPTIKIIIFANNWFLFHFSRWNSPKGEIFINQSMMNKIYLLFTCIFLTGAYRTSFTCFQAPILDNNVLDNWFNATTLFEYCSLGVYSCFFPPSSNKILLDFRHLLLAVKKKIIITHVREINWQWHNFREFGQIKKLSLVRR